MNFVGECPPDHDGLTACTGGIHELYWDNGYLFLWGLILLVTVAAIVSFVLLGIIPLPTFKRKSDATVPYDDESTPLKATIKAKPVDDPTNVFSAGLASFDPASVLSAAAVSKAGAGKGREKAYTNPNSSERLREREKEKGR